MRRRTRVLRESWRLLFILASPVVSLMILWRKRGFQLRVFCFLSTVRLHDSIAEEGFHYLVFDL